MQSVLKARAKIDALLPNDRHNSRRNDGTQVPAIFRPPYSGSGYYGREYAWAQVAHAYRFWSFACINATIRAVASGTEANIGRIDRDDDKAKAITKGPPSAGVQRARIICKSQRLINKSLAGPKEHECFTPYPHDHPLVKLFRNPNKLDVAYDLWAYHTLFLELTGRSHWYVIKNDFGTPVEIWVIPSHWLQLYTDREGQPSCWQVQSPWGVLRYIPFEDVVSFYQHSPLNRYEGYAVSLAINEWLDAYESMIRMRLAVWKNGAVPNLHIALGEAYMDPDEAFLARFYAKWLSRFGGEDNSGKPLITGPDVEVKGIDGHRPADALQATNDTEEKIRDMVLAAYGTPKGVLGLEPAADTSAYAPMRQYLRFKINPLLTYMGQVIQEKIIKPCDKDGVFWWDDQTIDDPEQQRQEIESRRTGSAITPNEERALYGVEAYPHGGDDPILGGSPVPWVTGEKVTSPAAEGSEAGGQLTPPPPVQQAIEPDPTGDHAYYVRDLLARHDDQQLLRELKRRRRHDEPYDESLGLELQTVSMRDLKAELQRRAQAKNGQEVDKDGDMADKADSEPLSEFERRFTKQPSMPQAIEERMMGGVGKSLSEEEKNAEWNSIWGKRRVAGESMFRGERHLRVESEGRHGPQMVLPWFLKEQIAHDEGQLASKRKKKDELNRLIDSWWAGDKIDGRDLIGLLRSENIKLPSNLESLLRGATVSTTSVSGGGFKTQEQVNRFRTAIYHHMNTLKERMDKGELVQLALGGSGGAAGGYTVPEEKNNGTRSPHLADEPFTVAVDFDWTLAGEGYEPMPEALESLAEMKRRGWKVVIYTSRVGPDLDFVHRWLKERDVKVDDVVGGKFRADVQIDDHGLHFTEWRQVMPEVRRWAERVGKTLVREKESYTERLYGKSVVLGNGVH